jgi:RNA polymerase sigma-70 factor, ECF subfamily
MRMNLVMETVETTEAALVASAMQGDREAYGELVYRYRTGVINVVYRLCGDADLAEDAAQTAFIRAWQHLAGYQPRSPFRNWLYRIAVNAALDVLRREKAVTSIDDLPLAVPGDGLEARQETRERREAVRQAVLALPEGSRTVLVLREYEGLTYQEIAVVLDIPAGTVMSRLSYARQRLAELLKPYLETV